MYPDMFDSELASQMILILKYPASLATTPVGAEGECPADKVVVVLLIAVVVVDSPAETVVVALTGVVEGVVEVVVVVVVVFVVVDVLVVVVVVEAIVVVRFVFISISPEFTTVVWQPDNRMFTTAKCDSNISNRSLAFIV